jgi:uncharacterized protein YbjQ (UPF0145 family)
LERAVAGLASEEVKCAFFRSQLALALIELGEGEAGRRAAEQSLEVLSGDTFRQARVHALVAAAFARLVCGDAKAATEAVLEARELAVEFGPDEQACVELCAAAVDPEALSPEQIGAEALAEIATKSAELRTVYRLAGVVSSD